MCESDLACVCNMILFFYFSFLFLIAKKLE